MCRGLALLVGVLAVAMSAIGSGSVSAQKAERPPHNQDTMPGPALSPQDAIKKMKLPDGFSVELVACEPDVVNPVAMTFDERGRIWIAESFEYPRKQAGKGRDRIRILESSKGDGKYDKVTVFAEGLNIPSGIAVGHGGVWVANSPDLLFYPEENGKAGKPEVVVTGFGRADTHELPNSLVWGPDGYLYGLNGVFNPSVVKHKDKEYAFTCALFRIDPRTRDFELFCEGTSNPWGVAFDTEGSAFVSACVIDHLWHLTESGYYHRQGGPYPPFTWKLGSIVKHKHQKAAYCGLHFFDSDAYPPEYREKLYMGNIHGGCINSDVLERDGSTYFAKPAPDLLTANDAWFMPVAQKTGPDGCLYILDWYDRYHCYQDANRDPAGIDRERGRIYRIRHKDSPKFPPAFDLKKESDDELIARLHSPNIFYRDLAQRLLVERNTPEIRKKLEKLVLEPKTPRKTRMHALWSLIGTGSLETQFHLALLESKDESAYRAWGVRAAGNYRKVDAAICNKVLSLTNDPAPDVRLQVAIAARKLDGVDGLPVLLNVLQSAGDDKVIPNVVWQNLHPLLETQTDSFLKALEKTDLKRSQNLNVILPRTLDRILGRRKPDSAHVADFFKVLLENKDADAETTRQCLGVLATKIQSGEVSAQQIPALRDSFQPTLKKLLAGKVDAPLYLDAALLAASLKEPSGLDAVRKVFHTPGQSEAIRLRAFHALIAGGDSGVLDSAAGVLSDPKSGSVQMRADLLAALGKLEDARVGEVVLTAYPKMESELQTRSIDLLTQRASWGKMLVKAVGDNKVAANAVSANQIRKLQTSKDAELVKLTREKLGTVREERNPEREKIVADIKSLMQKNTGDAKAGRLVFKNTCAQCHKIYNDGQDVGPDITSNGRASFDQLLSNIFDPSLVIGSSYQATSVFTVKGRSLVGLLVEDSPQRVVLKVQGGKLETIARADIDDITISKISLMPEGFEKQLKPQELLDLLAFLTLDRPPEDKEAKLIPGTPK